MTMRYEDPAAPTGRTRVSIDGSWHTVIPLDSLEGIGYGARGSITYPETVGWATTTIGSTRFAAWYPERAA